MKKYKMGKDTMDILKYKFKIKTKIGLKYKLRETKNNKPYILN